MMESEELRTLRIVFEEYYPTPPNNLQAQAQLETEWRRELTENQKNILWEKQLKRWSDKWWSFYHRFNDEAREIKKLYLLHTHFFASIHIHSTPVSPNFDFTSCFILPDCDYLELQTRCIHRSEWHRKLTCASLQCNQ